MRSNLLCKILDRLEGRVEGSVVAVLVGESEVAVEQAQVVSSSLVNGHL